MMAIALLATVASFTVLAPIPTILLLLCWLLVFTIRDFYLATRPTDEPPTVFPGEAYRP